MSAGAIAGASSSPSWVGETLDGSGSWTLRAKAPWLIGLLMLFDSWDSVVIAYTLPVLIGEWKLSPLQSGWLISAGYGAQFLGAIVFGSLAERYGRLPILKSLVFVMSVLGVACAMAGSYDQLITLRALQGLAIGGALPVAICYINEIAPTATRGRFFGTFQFLMTSGFGLAALSGAWLIPAFGWRVMFAIGAVPLLALPFTWMLPESPRWLAGRGRLDEAARSLERLGSGALPVARPPIPGSGEKVPYAMLFEKDIRNTSIVTVLLWFLTSLVSFGLVTWIPSIYVSMFKIPVADALRYNIVVAVSIFILPIFLRQTIDRIGRRPPPMIGTAVGGLALLAMIFISINANTTLLLVSLAIVGQIGISIGSMVLWPYTAETYPTRIRSLALGTSSSVARLASMLTPVLVGGVMQATGSVTLVFLVFGLASFTVAMLWLFGVRETAGRKMAD
jgi:putative MFS transporter